MGYQIVLKPKSGKQFTYTSDKGPTPNVGDTVTQGTLKYRVTSRDVVITEHGMALVCGVRRLMFGL